MDRSTSAASRQVVHALRAGRRSRHAVDVGDSDVDNLVLSATGGVNIPGRVTVERGLAPAGSVDLSNLVFQVLRDPESIGAPPGGPRFNPPPAADGSFAWTIQPGDYRVSVFPLDNRQRDDRTRAGGGPPVSDALQNAYLKSIRWGRQMCSRMGFTRGAGRKELSSWSSASPAPRSREPFATSRVSPRKESWSSPFRTEATEAGVICTARDDRQLRALRAPGPRARRLFVLRLGRSGARSVGKRGVHARVRRSRSVRAVARRQERRRWI